MVGSFRVKGVENECSNLFMLFFGKQRQEFSKNLPFFNSVSGFIN